MVLQGTTMRVLLAEDDQLLGEGLSAGLQKLGYTVDWVRDGIAAEQAMRTEHLDVLILDLGLPRQSGLEILRKLRASNNDLPVLILTARDSLEERVAGLDLGADDYMVKPFDLMELAARLRSITRRRTGRATPIIHYGELTLDPAARTVIQNGENVTLGSSEFVVLEALLNGCGRVFTREQLEEALYGWEDGVKSNAMEVYIHYLRKKLGKELIRTVRGVGYTIPKLMVDD
jgi:DNA-binding response OmpR family regulator